MTGPTVDELTEGDEALELQDTEFVDDSVTEYDLLFPVIPAEDDPYPPDEGGSAGLIDDIEDMAAAEELEDPQVATAPADETELAMDWDAGEFFLAHPGSGGDVRLRTRVAAEPLRVRGIDAIAEWVLKALNTQRGEFPIYPVDEDGIGFGTNVRKLLGTKLAEPALYAEIDRDYRETLLFHPRITRVEVNEIRKALGYPDALFVALTFYVDGDEEPVDVQVIT